MDECVERFFEAVDEGHVDVVEKLLADGFAIETIDPRDDDGDTALIGAIRNGQLDLACVLLQHGANVNAVVRFTTSTTSHCCNFCHRTRAKTRL